MQRNWPVVFLVLACLIALFPPTWMVYMDGIGTNFELRPRFVLAPKLLLSAGTQAPERDGATETALILICLFTFAVFMPKKTFSGT